jgi:hypothetical protein
MYFQYFVVLWNSDMVKSRHGRDRMVVGFITNNEITA